jgi:aryl-alcohol dehydrogenase-like predicted oxidoreductase
MNYRCLGRTLLQVSEISLGTVELGLDYGVPVGGEQRRPPEEQASLLLNQALDRGVNLIDTARAYGTSEEVIGRALKTRRAEYILASKLASIEDEGFTDEEVRRKVKASVTESLHALQTEVIDVLQLHQAPADLVRRGRLFEAMREVQQAGMVRYLGASTYGVQAPLAVLEDGRYDTLQVAYNLVDRRLESQVLPLAQQKNVGVIVRSVLLRGVLTHRYVHVPDQLAELRTAIEQLSKLVGSDVASLPEMAYRFVLAQPTIATALVGTARLEELTAALEYARRGPFSPKLLADIQAVSINDQNQLDPGTWPSQEATWQGTHPTK